MNRIYHVIIEINKLIVNFISRKICARVAIYSEIIQSIYYSIANITIIVIFFEYSNINCTYVIFYFRSEKHIALILHYFKDQNINIHI